MAEMYDESLPSLPPDRRTSVNRPFPEAPVPAMHHGSAPASPAQAGFTIGFVLSVVRQWWKAALPLGLVLGSVAAGGAYLVFRPVYRAFVYLQISDLSPYVAFPNKDDSRGFVETQVQLIQTPLVMGPVVSQPEIAAIKEIEQAEDPIKWLQKNVKVASVGRSELFTISCGCSTAAGTAKIVNAVADAYFNIRGQTDAEQTMKVLELLDNDVERRSGKVKRMREQVRELTKQATGRDPYAAPSAKESTMMTVTPVLADLHNRLITAEVEEDVLKAEITAYEEISKKKKVEVPAAAVEKAVEDNRQIQELEADLLMKKHNLMAYESASARGKQDRAYIRLAEAVKAAEQQIELLRNDLRQKVRGRLAEEAVKDRSDKLAAMKSQLESCGIKKKLLQERYDSQLKDNKEYSGETFELEVQRDDLAREQKVLEMIEDRAIRLRAEMGAPARVKLLKRAEPPTSPEDFKYSKLIMAWLAGFCLPFGVVVLWERFVRRVSDSQQLEQQANLAVVGEIARLPVRARGSQNVSAGRVGERMALFEESIDSLRTSLLLSEELRGMKVLVITSATNNEGKTSVAVELAVSIAQATGHTTLLVDGDMRAPDIHRLLNVGLEPGLAEVLGHECVPPDAILNDWSKYVHVLPAGKLNGSPHRLLGNGAVGALLKQLRSGYEYIVIDTPPLLACAESLVLAKAADAVLLCAMRDVSRVEQVRKAHEKLVAAGARPVGIVLNGVPAQTYTYRYGSYHYTKRRPSRNGAAVS